MANGSCGKWDYDLIVIGGGSGGMASAKEAATLGKKVCLFDFVQPSTHGTTWGIGGTCVNVGCVPKKLMHYSSLIGSAIHRDAAKYGWKVPTESVKHDWGTLVKMVQNHIKSLNFGYKNALRSSGVKYINALARFQGKHQVSYRPTPTAEEISVSAQHIIVAVGGRPHVPADVPGARELAITSDDVFSLKTPPGKTLVVGGAYIALECAGFLTELGYDVTVCVRSILLRGFDQQCAEKVGAVMKELGTKFIRPTTPKNMRADGQRIKVEFCNGQEDVYDTVIYATGRDAHTGSLGLAAVGVERQANGKVQCENETTGVPSVHAIGDCLYKRPELTPVAIQAGERLARRLFGGATKQMDYDNIATTVFTPAEYGCCGLSEEDAMTRYGDEVETYLSEFNSLEAEASHREKVEACRSSEFDTTMQADCLAKLVCRREKRGGRMVERVVGFHFVGPNAGEVTQGMAIAVHLGATKEHFDDVVGIHPTAAEAFTALSVTRRSGKPFLAAGGCGGGKCG